MSFTPFTYERHLKFLLDTLGQKVPSADLSTGSFWQIWAQGQARGLAGITSGLSYTTRQILPDQAVGIDLDHHAHVYDQPRLQPAKASGKVRATATGPDPVFPTGGKLKDITGRTYTYQEPASVPLAGTFEMWVESEQAGEAASQDPSTPLYFDPAPDPLDKLDPEVMVIEPGLIGGRDLEGDPDLQLRIVDQLSGEANEDTVADYKQWVLGPGLIDLDGDLYKVDEVYVYQDDEAPNRVYIMPLLGFPDRIGPRGFLQSVYNRVDRRLPVSVDLVVPLVVEKPIDMELKLEPVPSMKWDWMGAKFVAMANDSDQVIEVYRETTLVGGEPVESGVDGLEPGMRVQINGEERQIGHVDHVNDTITVVEPFTSIPVAATTYATPILPGGPVVAKVLQAITDLFRTMGPIHKVLVPGAGPNPLLASVITDTLMELDSVHDVRVLEPGDILSGDLTDAYLAGKVAYLPVPGEISVRPMQEIFL